LIEFAINDSWQESIKAIPFVVVYGRRPPLPLDAILRGEEGPANCDSATETARMIANAVKKAKAAMDAAQQRQKAYADARRRDVQLGNKCCSAQPTLSLSLKAHPSYFPSGLGPTR
jgi:hypothetical protein